MPSEATAGILLNYVWDLCDQAIDLRYEYVGPGMDDPSILAFEADIHPHGTKGDVLRAMGFYVEKEGSLWVYYLRDLFTPSLPEGMLTYDDPEEDFLEDGDPEDLDPFAG